MPLICFSEKTNSTSMSTATPIRAMMTFITLSEMCDAWYAMARRLATSVPPDNAALPNATMRSAPPRH